ncbi:hypothetical protein LZ30DRAFT_655505, partial [Colletotrichum cereale]
FIGVSAVVALHANYACLALFTVYLYVSFEPLVALLISDKTPKCSARRCTA